jgi:hypothetical protein
VMAPTGRSPRPKAVGWCLTSHAAIRKRPAPNPNPPNRRLVMPANFPGIHTLTPGTFEGADSRDV